MTAKNYFSRRPKNVSIFPTVSSLIKCSIFSVSSSLASPHTFSSSAATAWCLRTRYAPFFSPSGVSVTQPYFSNAESRLSERRRRSRRHGSGHAEPFGQVLYPHRHAARAVDHLQKVLEIRADLPRRKLNIRALRKKFSVFGFPYTIIPIYCYCETKFQRYNI